MATADLDRLKRLASENWDFAAMARFCALRMRTYEGAWALHAFADFVFLEALAFQRSLRGGQERA